MPQGIFGWKGLGKDKTNQTAIATVSAIINWVLAAYTVSELGMKDAAGVFRFTAHHITTGYYVLASATIVACALSAALINFEDVESRWGARVLVCGLPALLVLIPPLVRGL